MCRKQTKQTSEGETAAICCSTCGQVIDSRKKYIDIHSSK